MAGIQDILGGTLLESVKGLIDSFHLSPEKAAEFKQVIADNSKEIEIAQIEADSKIADSLSKETQAAIDAYAREQTSDDSYTKHWRPTFGYMVTLLLFWNYAMLPLFHVAPVTIPDRLFEMFGALLLVAIGGRSFEKIFGGNGSK
jgi:hypothetical protein